MRHPASRTQTPRWSTAPIPPQSARGAPRAQRRRRAGPARSPAPRRHRGSWRTAPCPSSFATAAGSTGCGVPPSAAAPSGETAAASRATSSRRRSRRNASKWAIKMVRQQDRLRPLQMRVARQDEVRVLLGQIYERPHSVEQTALYLLRRILNK